MIENIKKYKNKRRPFTQMLKEERISHRLLKSHTTEEPQEGP